MLASKIPTDQIKPVITILYVVIAASLWKYTSLPLAGFEQNWPVLFWMGSYKLLAAFLLFGLIPMGIVRWVFKESLCDYGLRLGVTKFTFRSFLIMAPFVVLIAILTGRQEAFYAVYPFNEAIRPENTSLSHAAFALHALIYLGYYFGWEFLFRGFLQHGLSERCGLATAIVVQTLASTMLHYGHPGSEVLGSIFAGLIWGFLAVRTQSILSGFAQHALLGIVLDWCIIYR